MNIFVINGPVGSKECFFYSNMWVLQNNIVLGACAGTNQCFGSARIDVFSFHIFHLHRIWWFASWREQPATFNKTYRLPFPVANFHSRTADAFCLTSSESLSTVTTRYPAFPRNSSFERWWKGGKRGRWLVLSCCLQETDNMVEKQVSDGGHCVHSSVFQEYITAARLVGGMNVLPTAPRCNERSHSLVTRFNSTVKASWRKCWRSTRIKTSRPPFSWERKSGVLRKSFVKSTSQATARLPKVSPWVFTFSPDTCYSGSALCVSFNHLSAVNGSRLEVWTPPHPQKKLKGGRPNPGVKAALASNDYRSPGENKCVSGVRND